MSSLKKQALSGVVWTFAQQFSVQIINFVVQIILARLLMPEMFGLIAMLSVFISIGQMLMDGGMTSSLIRAKNPDQYDYSTVFVTNFIVSFVAYIITFIAAPYIAKFYNQDILKDILRVYSLTFVVSSFVAVHVAKLTKEMNFKTQMILQIPSTIVGAIVGVVLAFNGYGVWSLVWLNLTQTIVFTIQNWIFIPWRPSFIFDKNRFKHHFSFGYKLTLSGLLDTVYNDIYKIVIGKFFNPASVGFFNQAETLRLFPVAQLSAVLGKVTYPLFSNITDDEILKSAYKKTMKLALFIVIPIMLVLIVIAKELFVFLLGEKWLPAVIYFQILSLASIVRPIGTYNLNILKVKGRSDLLLKLEVMKKIIGVILIVVALPFGITALVISHVLFSYISTTLNMIYSGGLINFRLWEQLKDNAVLFIIGALSFIISFIIRIFLLTYLNDLFTMIITAVAYAISYLVLVFLFEKKTLIYLISLIKK